MAWNEPGGNNRDPWRGNGRDQGPPDLDELMRKLSQRFGGLFGGRKPSVGSGGPQISSTGLLIIGAIVLIVWLASGIYTVEQGRRGVELRFGSYTETTNPGLQYHLPYPIESVEIVDVDQRRAIELGYRSGDVRSGRSAALTDEALMLTEDENIVDVSLSVQYDVKDAENYLFNVQDPDSTLTQVVESATREVVGRSSMDFVLTEGRSDIVAEIQSMSQDILDQYQTGLRITNVNLQDAQPPEQVQDAFADAIKAREDEQRLINEAEAYRNEILPLARGEAARQLQEAEAYKEQVIARAEGEAQRFEQLLTEYAKAPGVTRERLYLETMEQVLDNTNVVLMGAQDSNNLMFLPLDQLIESRPPARSSSAIDDFDTPSRDGASSSASMSGSALSRLRDGRRREPR